MKEIIVKIFPPIIRDIIVQLRNNGSLRFLGKIFTGVFTTFDEVSRAFPGTVAYNSADSEREEVARAQHVQTMIRAAEHGIAPAPVERYTLLATLLNALPSENVAILDIGGGMGDALPHLIYSGPQKKIDLTVLELPRIAAAGQKAFQGDHAVRFIDDIAHAKQSVDVVFMGSSLQYFEDYQSFIQQIAALRPHVIAITHTPMTDAPTFVTAQVNMRRRVMPNKIINRAELTALFEGLDYSLIGRSESWTAAHFRNFPAPQSMSSFSNMVFKIKTHRA